MFIAAEQALRITGEPNYIPTVLLLGAFIVPVTFVVYFYERERSIDRESGHREPPLAAGVVCFFVGGVLGVVAAGLVEYGTLRGMGALGLLGVGLVEEVAKLILPVVLLVRARFKTEADGLLFGVASGMGFAALETMGYGLATLISSRGDVASFESVLLVRGLLSPAGHAAWTGLVCAVLWRERMRRGHTVLNLAVIGAFLLAVALHTAWNVINSLGGQTTAQTVIVIVGNLVMIFLSLFLVFRRAYESVRFAGT